MATPRVSVVMTVFNAERYVDLAVQSILSQTFTDFEFLIYDDGSTDRSASILRKYAAQDARIRLFCMEHAGIVRWANEGLATAQGEYLARMDADDISLSTRFEKQVQYLDQNPTCMIVGAAVKVIDAEGEVLYPVLYPADHAEIDRRILESDAPSILQPTVIMRRRAVVAAGGYRKEYEGCEDLDLFLRMAEIGLLANLPEILLKYRAHLKSITHSMTEVLLQRRMRLTDEACARRGIPAPKWRTQEQTVSTVIDYYHNWCRKAVNAGYHRAARKYAWRIFRKEPFNFSNWRLFADAALGPNRKERIKTRFRRLVGLAPTQSGGSHP